MKTMIDSTYFGSITLSGKTYEHDIVIGLDGQVRKRMKELSRTKYGTSHVVSLEEANDLFEAGANQLIIGTGQTGYVKLSEEAVDYFRDNGCSVLLLPTKQAIEAWNAAKGSVIGLFHVTC